MEAARRRRAGPDRLCQTGDTLSSRFYRSGRRDAATGTYQLGSRTYDPARAGFHTPDSYRNAPATADLSIGTDPLTDNRYSYVNGDPVNLVDPDGHAPTEGDGRSGPAPGYPGGGPTGGGSSSSGGTTAGTNSDSTAEAFPRLAGGGRRHPDPRPSRGRGRGRGGVGVRDCQR